MDLNIVLHNMMAFVDCLNNSNVSRWTELSL